MRPTHVTKFVMLSMLLFVVTLLNAGTVTHHFTFSPPELIDTEEGYQIVMTNTRSLGYPGEPLLPVFGTVLLLPPGEELVSVEIILGQETTIPGNYFIVPAQKEYPLSYQGPYEPVPPKPGIYESDSPYPANPVGTTSTQFYRGYAIGYAAITPVSYRPLSGRISYVADLDVVFHTETIPRATNTLATMLRSDPKTLNSLSGMIRNTQMISAYPAQNETDEIPVEYIIITSNEYVTDFQTLSYFKNRRGVRTIIETIENITASQPGIDAQDKIRNYIISAYQSWGINYVLLAADVEIVPHRNLYAAAYTYTDQIAADLYYGGLDGNWNNDGDSQWGEPGEDDLVPEVAVGRAAIDSHTEAINFINKQILYQQSPVLSECTKALFVGELLWDDVYCTWTFGGTYKDEIRFGSSAHGYTTVGFPPQFQNTTLYDLTICPSSWSALGNLLPLLNSGFNIVNHLGHSNVTYCMRFNGSDVTDVNFTNNGTNHGLWIGYSQGCYDGSFDNRTTSGGYTTEDCILERFTTIQNGPVCFVGNARYGWGQHSSTDGSSQYFDRQFFDAIFGENITHIGPANDDSKVDNIWSISYQANRWCYYELNVFGDPELDMWTNVPQTLVPNYPSAYVIGQDTFRVTVSGVPGAVVALNFDSTLVARGVTNASGQVDIIFDSPPDHPGTMEVVITAHNYLEYSDDVQVIPPAGPYVLYRSHTLNDMSGNNNGLLDYGETIALSLTMENVGNDNASNITVTLSTDDPYITITDNTEYYGTILAHTLATVTDGFSFFVVPEILDNHVVVFDVTATSTTLDEWQDDFSLIAHAPEVSISSFAVNDASGNNNSRLDPGESATVNITLNNSGSSDVGSLIGTLSTDYSYVSVSPSMATLASLPSGGNDLLTPSYGIQVSPTTPSFSRAVFYLALGGNRDYNSSLLYEVTIGSYYESVEFGIGQWTHINNPGWTDQWHISTESTHSPSHAWKCGDTGTGTYANLLDAVLTSPAITIPANTKLTFWHWMDAEQSSYYPDSAYDGGNVEISVNEGAWQLLTPEGGYSHHSRYSAGGGNPYTGPFAGGTPCFSGAIDWEQVAINLSSYSGNIKIRFRFGSDQSAAREGWYIDDVEIVLTDDLAPPENLQGHLIGTYAHLDWNSPGVDGLLGYNVYRNGELIETSYQGLHYQNNLAGLPEALYAYTVTALYDAGESSHTAPVTIDYTSGLESVDDLTISKSGSHIFLTWSPVTNATAYNVYRGTDPNTEPGEMTLIASPTNPTYMDANIINGTDPALFYVVTATR